MKYGLIGERLGHSYSKEIHEKIGSYSYELKEIEKDKLEAFIKDRDYLGINVTIPYKERVIPYLDEISEGARLIGSVNTIVNRGGKLYGYNTDFDGMKAMTEHSKIKTAGKKVLILGTGGTSKTAYAVMKHLKAKEIILVSRSEKENAITLHEAYAHHTDADIIINTTPVGMYPKNYDMPIDIDLFPRLSGVIDVIYNPLSTMLINKAKAKNIPCSGGLYMLSAQAVYASALFFGKEPDKSVIDKAYDMVKKEKQNIVLIGMPTSRKSTVGGILSRKLALPLSDTDAEIEKRIGMKIPEFFSRYGEAAFRDEEKKVIADISRVGGQIIATGGGAVLNPDNVNALKQNGIIIFLNRSLNGLFAAKNRPLSSDKDALEKMFNFRLPIYKAACDIIITSDGTSSEVTKMILKEMEK